MEIEFEDVPNNGELFASSPLILQGDNDRLHDDANLQCPPHPPPPCYAQGGTPSGGPRQSR